MSCRSRDNQGKFLPKPPNPSSSQPSLFLCGNELPTLTTVELENPLGVQPKIFEESIGEGEPISPIQNMFENMQIELFPIRETNVEARMKNISPTSLPHFRGLASMDPDTFVFEFFVVSRTYDYTSNEKKLKLFPSTLRDVTSHWFMSLEGGSITTWAQM